MDNDEKGYKKFLDEQLKWCKEQDCILEEMNMKLHE